MFGSTEMQKVYSCMFNSLINSLKTQRSQIFYDFYRVLLTLQLFDNFLLVFITLCPKGSRKAPRESTCVDLSTTGDSNEVPQKGKLTNRDVSAESATTVSMPQKGRTAEVTFICLLFFELKNVAKPFSF